jgi:mannose-6-phosphate isomerase-like protein (cupin superfamily)
MTRPTSAIAAPGSAPSWWCLGTRSTVLVGREQTAGLFTLIEIQAPSGLTVPRHVHRLEDETLLVREGTLQVECGDDTWTAQPGMTVFLPQRVPHAFAVVSDTPLLAWQITAPAGHEDFLAAVGEPATGPGPPLHPQHDLRQLVDAAATYGVDILTHH